nr:winged helix-turn-helix domain-containing protein [Nannocystis pusilla]
MRRRFEVVPRIDILREVFGYSRDPGTNAIDVHLAHLRRKLADLPIALETVRGAGFRARVTGP